MSTRAARSVMRRKAWFLPRVKTAPTRRAALRVACDWLTAEAVAAGRVDDAIDAVLAATNEIRKEATA